MKIKSETHFSYKCSQTWEHRLLLQVGLASFPTGGFTISESTERKAFYLVNIIIDRCTFIYIYIKRLPKMLIVSTLESGINIRVRLLIFEVFSRGYVLIKGGYVYWFFIFKKLFKNFLLSFPLVKLSAI